MKIKIKDKDLLKALAEVCYDELCNDFTNGISINGALYDLIDEKVAKLIEENKDIILDRAANMVTDSVSLKKALDLMSVELEEEQF